MHARIGKIKATDGGHGIVVELETRSSFNHNARRDTNRVYLSDEHEEALWLLLKSRRDGIELKALERKKEQAKDYIAIYHNLANYGENELADRCLGKVKELLADHGSPDTFIEDTRKEMVDRARQSVVEVATKALNKPAE